MKSFHKYPIKYALILAGISILVSFTTAVFLTKISTMPSFIPNPQFILGFLQILSFCIQLYLICHMLRKIYRENKLAALTKDLYANLGLFVLFHGIFITLLYFITPFYYKILGESDPFSLLNDNAYGQQSTAKILLLIFLSTTLISALLSLISITIASRWVVYKTAGRKGWHSIVPFVNIVMLLEIVKKPEWWFFLYFIPGLNIIISIIVINQLAKRYNQNEGFTTGLILLPFAFWPLLAFDKNYTSTNAELEQLGNE